MECKDDQNQPTTLYDTFRESEGDSHQNTHQNSKPAWSEMSSEPSIDHDVSLHTANDANNENDQENKYYWDNTEIMKLTFQDNNQIDPL